MRIFGGKGWEREAVYLTKERDPLIGSAVILELSMAGKGSMLLIEYLAAFLSETTTSTNPG